MQKSTNTLRSWVLGTAIVALGTAVSLQAAPQRMHATTGWHAASDTMPMPHDTTTKQDTTTKPDTTK